MQGGWMAAVSETYANQYGYFKLVYDYGWGALNAANAYGYKGIMFWRWDPTGAAGSGFDEAATIGGGSADPQDSSGAVTDFACLGDSRTRSCCRAPDPAPCACV
jgi:hypothetical protein